MKECVLLWSFNFFGRKHLWCSLDTNNLIPKKTSTQMQATILHINELGGPGYAPFNMSPLKYFICTCVIEYCHLTIRAISLFSHKEAYPGSLVCLTEYRFFRSAWACPRSCLFLSLVIHLSNGFQLQHSSISHSPLSPGTECIPSGTIRPARFPETLTPETTADELSRSPPGH